MVRKKSFSRAFSTTLARQHLQQLQKRNAGSLHYGGKCAASGRDDSVLLIPKTSLKKEVKIHESVSAIIAEVGAVLWVGNVVVHLQRVVVVGDVSDG
jgi:hypothetical protein